MAENTLDKCLTEILTDENGQTITPTCGIEKLLYLLCECAQTDVSSLTTSEIDNIISS